MVSINESIEKICYYLDKSTSSAIEVNDNNKVIGSISKTEFSRWLINNPDLQGNAFSILSNRNLTTKKNTLLHNEPVVIMAGGKGNRVAPFTKVLPKPLIPIKNKTILQIIFEEFSKQGSSNFNICLNHKANLIKAYLSEFEKNHDFYYTIEEKPLGTIGAISLLKRNLHSHFFVTNCDTIIDACYADILDFHAVNKNFITIVGCLKYHEIPYGICEFKAGGQLVDFFEKPNLPKIVNTGMYVMSPLVLDYIPSNAFFNITELLQIAKREKLSVLVYPITHGSWKDIGNWKEYKEVTQFIASEDACFN